MPKPEKLKVLGVHYEPNGTKVTTVEMPSDLKQKLDDYHWRMAEAERLLDDQVYFYIMFKDLPSSRYPQLIRNALAAYLRENRD
jgi:hypothetical protein